MVRASRALMLLQAIGILLLALLVTVAAWWQVREHGRGLLEARFSAVVDQVVEGIGGRMEDYEQILRGGVGLFEAVGEVDRRQWRTYVERLRVGDNYPGIQGIGFAKHVRGHELAEHVATVRAEGFPDYAVSPDGNRADLFPIIFLEPFSGRNLRAFGFDMFVEPIRREAMTRAMEQGVSALSGAVTLVQETDEDLQAGTLLYLPVYAAGADLGSAAGRRQAIVGFVYSPFRMDDLIRATLGDDHRLVQVEIRDGDAVLYGGGLGKTTHSTSRAIEVYGRRWLIQVRATPALEASMTADRSPVVLGAGILVSLLLAWVTLAMLAERRRRLALAAANRALAAARAEAEAANRAKSRFLAAASHDIRQPVQSIMLLTGTLARQLGDHPAQKLLHYLDRATDSLSSLLRALLDVSRLDAGAIVPEMATVPLHPLLMPLAEEYRLRAEEKGLAFHSAIAPAATRTDPALLERILRNLLENALRYTREGRVTLRCTIRGDEVLVEVEDTGIGISAEQLQQVFEEFYQAENGGDGAQGLGLGLSIVRRLAKLLALRVDVRSQPGRGSCFTIALPRVPVEKSLVA